MPADVTALIAPAPRRAEFATSDPEEAREYIGRTFAGAGLRVTNPHDGGWEVSITAVDAGQFASTDIRLPADLDFTVEYDDQVFISTVVEGWTSLDRRGVTTHYRTGDVVIGSCAQADWSCHTHQFRDTTITLRESLLQEAAGDPPDEPARPWQPLAYEPLPGRSAQWRRTARFVDDLLANPDSAGSPLVIGSAGRLLAATALAVFPSTANIAPNATDRCDAHHDTLRRAIAFIEANPDLDIGVVDIARAAHVTPRAVQLAFRRHLDTTPVAYLRHVRLELVHDSLREATPGDGQTVAAIAARWGFTSLSRFTAQYRAEYGEPPSHTLRH